MQIMHMIELYGREHSRQLWKAQTEKVLLYQDLMAVIRFIVRTLKFGAFL